MVYGLLTRIGESVRYACCGWPAAAAHPAFPKRAAETPLDRSMYAKTLVLLICCIAIGTAVGSYVDRDAPATVQFAQSELTYDAGLVQSCMAEARAELERLNRRIGYYERDLRRACREAVASGRFARN